MLRLAKAVKPQFKRADGILVRHVYKWGRLRTAMVAVAVAATLAAAWAYWGRQTRAAPSPPNAYVDATICADCHGEIAASHHQTGMGRSFARLTPETAMSFGKPFHHVASGSYFAMIERRGKYYQRQWHIGFDGKETNIDEKSVDFVIGSGNHARTFLHWTDRHMLQVLPLSWYSEKGGYWEMSPGYDHPDHPGSVRPVHYECMFCHNPIRRSPNPPSERPARK